MSKRVKRVPYTLDPKGTSPLPIEELTAILRGADDLIMSGDCRKSPIFEYFSFAVQT